MLRIKFYVPRGLVDSEGIKETDNLLNKVESSLKLKVSKHIIDQKGGDDLKSQILWGLAVAKRIRIKQTRKTKSLYSQLVVFSNGKAVTFYPQSRAREEITIQEFLRGLLNGEVKCLHERYEIEDELKSGTLKFLC